MWYNSFIIGGEKMPFRFVPFVVTPAELEEILAPFTLFVGSVHVPADYRSTPASEFAGNYNAVYSLLCSGERVDIRSSSKLLTDFFVTTDIDSVVFGNPHEYDGEQYKMYTGTSRGYAPYLAPFSFSAREEYDRIIVSTRESYLIEKAAIMGFQLVFSKEAEKDVSADDFKLFKDRLAKHTKPLRFTMNGFEKKTVIRVSDEAKKDLRGFYCVKCMNIEIL